MLNQLRMKNFKSWEDTGDIRLAPLTGLFGANSSGKSAVLQLLLLLKQTQESTDPSIVLHLGQDERAYVYLGEMRDVLSHRENEGKLSFGLSWASSEPLHIPDPVSNDGSSLFRIGTIEFCASIAAVAGGFWVESFDYRFNNGEQHCSFGMYQKEFSKYELFSKGYIIEPFANTPPWPLPAPFKFYAFPDSTFARYRNSAFLRTLAFDFEEQLRRVHYLGPTRRDPRRAYFWDGEEPADVGPQGQRTVPTLLAAERARAQPNRRFDRRNGPSVMRRVAEWLRELGLIDSFRLARHGASMEDNEIRSSGEFQVWVQQSPGSEEVLLPSIGFGVSQVLPILTQCYYAPEGSTLILEHPEMHLHPKAQAGLADVFIDAIRTRNIQIILESHSEHLLHRLQRRIAEERVDSDSCALYFIDNPDGRSRIDELKLTAYGDITNWPENFFGDDLGDLVAMTKESIRRRKEQR